MKLNIVILVLLAFLITGLGLLPRAAGAVERDWRQNDATVFYFGLGFSSWVDSESFTFKGLTGQKYEISMDPGYGARLDFGYHLRVFYLGLYTTYHQNQAKLKGLGLNAETDWTLSDFSIGLELGGRWRVAKWFAIQWPFSFGYNGISLDTKDNSFDASTIVESGDEKLGDDCGEFLTGLRFEFLVAEHHAFYIGLQSGYLFTNNGGTEMQELGTYPMYTQVGYRVYY